MIRLLPTGWCRAIPQGTRRMSDAVINKSEQGSAIVSVVSERVSEQVYIVVSLYSAL